MLRLIVRQFFMIAFAVFLILSSCSDWGSDGSQDVIGSIIDTLVDNSEHPVEVAIPGTLTIQIPTGTIPDGSKLSIKEIDAAYYPADSLHQIQKVYDIKIGKITEFDTVITITLNYDPALLEDSPVKNRLGAAYYSTDLKRWLEFKDVTCDSVLCTVTFKTKHLTHVTFYEFCTNGGLPFKFESKHFRIYYALSGTKKVPDNAGYKSEPDSWNTVSGGYEPPYYITDLAHWLEETYTAFASTAIGFEVPTSIVNVYVTPLKGSEGEFGSVAGCIYINNSVEVAAEVNDKFNQAGWLKMTAAHEFLHYTQDYYYAVNWKPNLWWLEATATLADRIVWSEQTMYESEAYAKKQSDDYGNLLHYALSRSWEDCNKYNWYQAGCFLYYLGYRRSGARLDIPQLIRKGGTSEGNYLTILDNEIISILGTDVGREYQDYVTYLYEGHDPNFALEWTSVYNENNKTEIDGYLYKSKPSKKITAVIPHLSTRIIKIRNADSDAKQVVINFNSLPEKVIGSLYKPQEGAMVFESSLWKGTTHLFNLPLKTFKDILLINASAENDAYVDLDLALGILAIEPALIENAELLVGYQFKAVVDKSAPAGIKYFWKILPDNKSFENTTGVLDYRFDNVGIYTIELTIFSQDNTILGKAESEVRVLPTITEITPSNPKPGDEVEITGLNFGSDESRGSVSFNGVTATEITDWGMWSIKAIVPNNAQSGDVVVTVDDIESNGFSLEIGVLEKTTIAFTKVDDWILGAQGNTITISFSADIMATAGAGLISVAEYFEVVQYGTDTTHYHELAVKVHSGTIGAKMSQMSVSFSGPQTTEITEGQYSINRFLGWDSLEVSGIGKNYKVKGNSASMIPIGTETLKFPSSIYCDYRRFDQWYSATQDKVLQEYSHHVYVIRFEL